MVETKCVSNECHSFKAVFSLNTASLAGIPGLFFLFQLMITRSHPRDPTHTIISKLLKSHCVYGNFNSKTNALLVHDSNNFILLSFDSFIKMSILILDQEFQVSVYCCAYSIDNISSLMVAGSSDLKDHFNVPICSIIVSTESCNAPIA